MKLFTLCLFVLTLAACSSNQRLLMSLGSGYSQARGTVDQDSVTGRGSSTSLRGELSQSLTRTQGFDVGLRVAGTARSAQASTETTDLDLVTSELSLVGVGRGYVPLSDSTSLYVEGFGGYAHDWVSGTIVGEGGGGLFGAGVGLESRTGLHLGLEWSRREFDVNQVDLRTDDFMFVLGSTIRF